MKKQFQSKSVPRGTRTIWRYLGALFLLFTFAIGNVWAAASTTTDGKYATGTIDFSTIGTLSATTTYWHNGVKFYSGNSANVSANNTAWSTSVSIPAYVSNVTAGKDANKCKWGNGGTAKQYTQSGFACSQHTIGIHVNQACTLTVVVNKNVGSDTDDAGISASIDDVAYGTAYTSSTYKAAGSTALTVTSARADKTNASGRYTLTIVVTAGDLTDGEAVVKMFNGSSGTGSGKLFCWESITVTAAAVTKHKVTYKLNGATGTTPTQADVAEGAKFTLHNGTTGITAPTNKDFDGWHDGTTKYAGGAEYTMGTSDVELTAQWKDHVAKYTLVYRVDGVAVGNEQVNVSGTPEGLASDPTKDCYTFAGWSPALSTVSGTDGATVYVDATWTGNYFTTSVDFENGGTSAVSGIASKNIVASNAGSYDGGKAEENWAYKGWKIKSNGATVKVLVKANKKLTYKFGYLAATAHVNITDDNITREVTGASKEEGNSLKYTIYSWIKDYDAVYTFTTGSADAAVIKALSVEAVYTAYFEDEMGVVTTTVVGNVTEVELPTPSVTTKSGKNFIGWKADQAVTVGGVAKAANTLLSAGDVAVLSATTTFTAQWVAPENFDVKFFQGYGDPDVQIGDKQTISTGGHAVAPADPTRTGFAFLGWSYDATAEHIVTVSEYPITVETDFTAMWKAVWTVTFDGAGAVNVEDGETVASPDSPTQAGKVFQGWYNGESKYDFSAAVTGNLALTSKWADADPNHYVYAYNDDFHFDGVVYKTPEGKVDGGSGTSNIALTTPYTLFAGAEGITSIVMTDGIYDSKIGAIQAVTALMKVNNNATSKLTVTIKSGYTATLKIKSSGYSATRTINVSDATPASGTTTGQAVTSGAMSVSGIGELSFALNAGSHDLTVTGGTLYIAELDIEATALPTYAVTYAANGGEGTMTDANEYYEGAEVTLLENTFTPASGFMWSGWIVTGNVSGDPIAVSEGKFTMPDEAVTVTAQWEDVSKVAVIVETNVKYESLAEAIAAATDGQTVQLLQNIHQEDGVLINKSLTLDLNGKTFTVDNGNSYVNRAIKVDAGTGTVLIKDGTVDALSTEDHNGGCYGGLRIETGNVTCTNVTFKNYRIYGMGVKPAGGTLVMNECTVISEIGGGMEVAGGSVVLNNCTFTQTGFDTAHAWISSCLGIGHNANLTVNGGTYTSEHYSLYVFTSGGEIDVESGSFTGDIVNQVTLSSYPDAVGAINISGGSFEGVGGNPIHFTTDNTGKTTIAISGGTFDAPVENQYCAPGYVPAPEVAPGVYTVMPKDGVCLVKIEPTSQTKGTQTGLYADGDELTINLSSGMNLGGSGKYIGVKATENFQEGDVLHLNMSTYQNSQNATAYVYADKDASVFLFDTEEKCDENKDYYITMPAAVNGHKELYIVRTEGNKWNGGPSVMEVTRAMKPMLTAITIDGRDGVIDEANKTVAVQIPYEADLANLTIVPTIVWNEAAASNSIVVNDGSAWIEGANTYKLTDKDGDYTVYAITLTRDVQKHAVKFYDGETLLETLEVENGTSIAAGDVPADPTKEDYIFQGWAETAGGDVVDVTSFTISAAKNFYAKWAADGAIKLINKTSGAVNEDGYFITGVTATEANSEKAAAWGGTQGTSISGVNALGKIVQYNATTNQTKIKIKVYNTNGSNKYVYIHKVVEGKTTEEAVETLTATSNTVVESEYYEFNDTKNRSFYLTTNSTDVKILQVKVIDDGATPMKQAGEAGYSLNLNKGRVVYYGNSDVTFEGLALNSASNYGVISSTEFQTVKNISFSISSPVLLKVTTNTAKYYVSQNPDEDGTTATAVTAAGTAEFELTETTNPWYLVPSTTSNVKYTNIAFELPKAATPVIETQPATNHTFDPGDMTATVVATVTEGTLHYQWYKKATVGDDEEVGTDAATLTTTTEGTYYVVVTNVLAGHQNTSVTSDEAELGYRVTNDATLMALSASEGTLDPTFDKDVEEYRVDLPEGTVDVPTLSATATMDGYATVNITDATAFVNYEATSTVVVTSEDATANKTYTVKFYVDHLLPQVDVTESTTWDWTYAAEGDVKIKVTDSTEPIKKNEEGLMANVRVDDNKPTNDATFNSQALLFYGENVRAKDGGRWYASLGHIKFNVTKPGIVEVEFSDNGSNNRCLSINGFMSPKSSSKTDIKTFKVFVPAGEVTLMGMEGAETDKYIRISKITYTVKETPDYERNVSSNYGTLCVEHNVLVGGAPGATFYQIASRNAEYDYKIDFEEVLPNEELKAGEPYLFKSNTGKIELFYGEETAASPIPVRGMIGNYAATTLPITAENKNTIYYFAQNKLWLCDNLVGGYLTLNDHRAYIDLTQVPTYAEYEASKQQQQNSAPRRRVSLEMNGEKIATGCENLNVSDKPVKMIINGQLFILRGEKMYDAKGQLVK